MIRMFYKNALLLHFTWPYPQNKNHEDLLIAFEGNVNQKAKVIGNILKIGPLKIRDLLCIENVIQIFPKILIISPFGQAYPHINIRLDPFITFGVTTKTGGQTDNKQTNRRNPKHITPW